MRCALREVRDEDLAVLFEQWADPVAARMAAFKRLITWTGTRSSAAGLGSEPTRA
jgi:hypothetical protein